MTDKLVLKAEKRSETGTRITRKVRAAGKVPAIIYGHKTEPVSVALNYHDLALEVQHHHRLLDVELDNKREKLLVKDIQRDHLGEKIIHVDLTRVNLDERVRVTVMVELRGIPAGAVDGGVLEQPLAEVELECLVTNIPGSIRASVMDMKVGDTMLAKDLELPAEAKLVTEGDMPVASVRVMAEEVVEPEAAAEEEAEPEVIAAREKQEEEEKDKSGE